MTGKPPTLTEDQIRSIREDIISGIKQGGDYPKSTRPTPLSIEVVESAVNDLRAASGMLNTFFETAVVRGTHHSKSPHWHPSALAFDFSEGFDIYFNEDWVITQNPAQMRGALYQIFLQTVNGSITKIGERNRHTWFIACNYVMNGALAQLVDKVGGQGFLKAPATELVSDEFTGMTIEQVYDELENQNSVTIDVTEIVYDDDQIIDEDEEASSVESDPQVFVSDTDKNTVEGRSKESSARVQAIIDKISHGLSPLKEAVPAEHVPAGINIAMFLTKEAGA